MSKTLRERLKDAAQDGEKKRILKSILDEFPFDENEVTFCERNFNDVLFCLDNKSVERIELSVSDESFFIRFDHFLKGLNSIGDVLFYVATEDNYYYLKLPVSFIKNKSDFFWKIKGHNHGISNCILIEEKGDFGFVKLYTEYGYELYEWV
ncbi:hypothetical protein LF934_22310 [Dickeya dadantii]|uniref:hypothetical protein n=1 Tax=Dickeya dadantii TaxID=204038 RepID=UPI001CF4BA21|nr:hypothetical protein [Dickeya dadantii]MCA7015362.1 hypothetical protein [Dickeya dadantii]